VGRAEEEVERMKNRQKTTPTPRGLTRTTLWVCVSDFPLTKRKLEIRTQRCQGSRKGTRAQIFEKNSQNDLGDLVKEYSVFSSLSLFFIIFCLFIIIIILVFLLYSVFSSLSSS
jgi:hypothetical protein